MKKDVVINSRWEWGQILMLRLERIALERGVSTIYKEQRAGWSQIASRTKGYRCVRSLGGSINPAALSSIERRLLSVHGE